MTDTVTPPHQQVAEAVGARHGLVVTHDLASQSIIIIAMEQGTPGVVVLPSPVVLSVVVATAGYDPRATLVYPSVYAFGDEAVALITPEGIAKMLAVTEDAKREASEVELRLKYEVLGPVDYGGALAADPDEEDDVPF